MLCPGIHRNLVNIQEKGYSSVLEIVKVLKNSLTETLLLGNGACCGISVYMRWKEPGQNEISALFYAVNTIGGIGLSQI